MAAYQAYTLEDLKQQLVDRSDETAFWNDTEAKDALNEALMVWNSMTGYWKERAVFDTTVGQNTYELPSSILFGFRVEHNSVPMAPSSLSEMDSGKPGWDTQTGTPRIWIPLDLNTIIIWPTPTVLGTLTVDGIAATPQLVYGPDFIQMGSDALDPIVGYALHVLALKEGGERFEASMKYFEEFIAAAGELNNQLEKSEMFRHFMGLDTKREEQPTR